MLEQVTLYLQSLEDILWGFFCFPLIFFLGILLTHQSGWAQVKLFPIALQNFWNLLWTRQQVKGQIHPLQAFFACVSGSVGIGNVVAVCTAVQIGGPGALIWLWATAILGAILKYSEVYLGLRYRIRDKAGKYRGGPMYYLPKVFKGSWAPALASVLLCLYGVEVYQFSVVTASLTVNFGWTKELIVGALVILILYAGRGGVGRVGKISSTVVPVFITIYVLMGLWVIGQHIEVLPKVLYNAVTAAFTGHAAVGGFAGSTILIALTHGMRRACYSGDLGVGYASVIHSESSEISPERQASLTFVEVFLDNFILSTTSILLILVTGVWQSGLPQELLVQEALATTFTHVEIFMPLFLFLLAYSTINGYFVVGLNCAEYLGGKPGRSIYFIYAGSVLVAFAYFDTTIAQTAMTLVGGMLLLLNCSAIFKLRHEISFALQPEEQLRSVTLGENEAGVVRS